MRKPDNIRGFGSNRLYNLYLDPQANVIENYNKNDEPTHGEGRIGIDVNLVVRDNYKFCYNNIPSFKLKSDNKSIYSL